MQVLFQSAQHLPEKREGSGSVPLTNGSGSGRPKNIRTWIPNTEKEVNPDCFAVRIVSCHIDTVAFCSALGIWIRAGQNCYLKRKNEEISLSKTFLLGMSLILESERHLKRFKKTPMTVFNKKISILHFNTFFVKNHGLDRIRIGSGFSESLNPDRILQIHTGIQINTIKFFFVRFVFLS